MQALNQDDVAAQAALKAALGEPAQAAAIVLAFQQQVSAIGLKRAGRALLAAAPGTSVQLEGDDD